jgi:hypothetical protein
LDYVNFNCWSWDGDNTTSEGLRANFERQYQLLESQALEVYGQTYNKVLDKMPFCNHSISQEQAHVSAWMNIVMETYSSDTTVAVSEKIFRAICLPVPWIAYSGQYTVAYLHSLGFDVLHDVVAHRYDGMIETRTAIHGDKMVDFLFEGVDAVERMQNDRPEMRARQAATTNQELLYTMRTQWPADFAAWWPAVVERIR